LAAVRVTFWGVPGVSESEAGVAVTPAGKPLIALSMLPVKPLSAVAASWTGCPVPPGVRLREVGVTAREKSGDVDITTTVIGRETVCVREPDVAVKVAVAFAAAVPVGAVKEIVAAVPGVSVTVDGSAVTPAGKPAIVTCTLEEKPFTGVARREAVTGVPLAVKVTAVGVTLREKSGCAAAWTESEVCALTIWPPIVAVSVTVEVAEAEDEAAVSVNGSATPGVADNTDGEIVTPAGSPDTAIVVAPVPEGAVSSREAFCPAAPAVNWMVDGVRVRVEALLVLLLLLQEATPTTTRLLATRERTPLKNRCRWRIEWNMAPPGGLAVLGRVCVLLRLVADPRSISRPVLAAGLILWRRQLPAVRKMLLLSCRKCDAVISLLGDVFTPKRLHERCIAAKMLAPERKLPLHQGGIEHP
jgi:hypothetical protein